MQIGRVVFFFAISLVFIEAAKAEQPVQIESDAGVISMMSAYGTKQPLLPRLGTSAPWGKADISVSRSNVR